MGSEMCIRDSNLVEPVHRADIRLIVSQRLAQKRGHTAGLVGRYDSCGLYCDYYVVIIINNIHGYSLSQLLIMFVSYTLSQLLKFVKAKCKL